MREVCKSGAVVAAVIAVLEKQNLNKRPPIDNTRRGHPPILFGSDENNACSTSGAIENSSTTRAEPENNNYRAEISFESAVDDFNSIAEDVEKICATDSLKRCRATSSKTDPHRQQQNQAEECNGVPSSNAYDSSDDRDCDISASDDSLECDDGGGGGGGADQSDSTTCTEDSSDSDEEREHVINEGLATIAEELSSTSAQSYPGADDDSSLENDSTLKEHNQAWSGAFSNQGSTSDLSTTSSEQHLSLKDSSTRCNSDFQWVRQEPPKPCIPPNPSNSPVRMEEVEGQPPLPLSKPPINRGSLREKSIRSKEKASAPGSLDRRRHHIQNHNRQERDQKARSSHILKSPPRLDDYLTSSSQNWCCVGNNPHEYCYENFQRRHERLDPQR